MARLEAHRQKQCTKAPWLGLLAALLAACGDGAREVRAFYESGALLSEGREVRVADDVWEKSGVFRTWYDTGDLQSEGEYRHDAPSGRWRYWRADGSLQARGAYLFGQKEGVWVHRVADGSLDEELTGVYEAGEKIDAFRIDGEHTDWYGENRPRERVTYLDGLRHGPAGSWYSDGSRRSEGQYTRGRKSGRWVYWREDGSIDEGLTGLHEGWQKVAD